MGGQFDEKDSLGTQKKDSKSEFKDVIQICKIISLSTNPLPLDSHKETSPFKINLMP